jgi:hypothetical protein
MKTGTMDVAQQQKMLDLLIGYWVSQAIYASAKLGVADLLKDGPLPITEIAGRVGADEPAMYRLMRALASKGLFEESAGQCFGLTPFGSCLCADHPFSLRAISLMCGDLQYDAWGDILYSIRSGRCAYDRRMGRSFFEMLEKTEGAPQIFSDAMTSFLHDIPQSVVEGYDFSGIGRLVDVGTGRGTLLSTILRAYPKMKGVLFDLPIVAEGARDHISAAGVASQCEIIGGSFFDSIPAGGDAYILSTVLHDWDDERSIAILKGCRKAIAPGGKLLIVELLIPDGNEPFFGKWLDMHMLVMHGGRDRTEAEYRHLIEASGFRFYRTIRTSFLRSVIEAVPV